MSTKDEALKLALEALEESRNALAWFYDSYPQDVTKKGNELLPHVETVLTAIREALAEQPAQQQEPVDKSGSPCPEFWDWLPKAYNFDGDGVFTKYNMEVAFLAGKQSVHAIDTLQERVDEAPKKVHDKLAQQQYQNTADNCELTPVPAKGGLQPDYRAMYLKVRDELAALQQSRTPLTSKEIRAIEVDVAMNLSLDYPSPAEQFTRSIEARHGIK